jgi:ketosteroid isomerase-like protein
MSQENVETVRRVMRGFNDPDFDAAREDIDPDAELDYSASDAPDGLVYHGHPGFRAFAQGRWEPWSERRFDITELIDAPPHTVVVVGRMRGSGRVSGVEVEASSTTVWTLHQGKITRVKLYRTRDEALAAVGLAG